MSIIDGVSESAREERERGLQQRTECTIYTDWFHLIIEHCVGLWKHCQNTQVQRVCGR